MPNRPPIHRPPQRPRHQVRTERPAELLAFYASTRWRTLARWFLRRNPLCADPYHWHQKEGRIEPATQVHHVVPLRVDISLGFDVTNLMAVCSGCHARLDAEARRTDRLDINDGGVDSKEETGHADV